MHNQWYLLLFPFSRGLPMRTTWLYTNTSTRWRWNLDQREQILLSLQVCLCVKQTVCSSFFRRFSVILSCALAYHSLSNSVAKNCQKSSSKNTLITLASTVSTKCEDAWIIPLLFFFFFLLLDQTPTPTRFLKNCEEVGLFNELASSFEQDEEDKRAKNSVRTLM